MFIYLSYWFIYLETKRTFFPRFYFLSNDDLLEILGQSKEPKAVQAHLSKCFDNIKRLEINDKKKSEALGMHSAEGEYVPFLEKVVAEGPVEIWLSGVESAMRSTLKKELVKAMVGFRRFKKDKWINDTPGQLIIASSQIAWTHEVRKALNDVEAGDKSALKELRRKQGANLKRLSDMVKGEKGYLHTSDFFLHPKLGFRYLPEEKSRLCESLNMHR